MTVASAAVRRNNLQILDLDITLKTFLDSDEESFIGNSRKESRFHNRSNGIDVGTNKSKNGMPPANVFIGESDSCDEEMRNCSNAGEDCSIDCNF